MTRATIRRYAWTLLTYNLVVVIWGAFVRASFSGDGCGAHWPLCGGTLFPSFKRAATAIEFAHRVSSVAVLPLCCVLIFMSIRLYPRGHRVRAGALLCLAFTLSEAALGAGLVLFKWVAHNPSGFRAVATSAHLVNTFILLAMITMTAAWASGAPPIRLRHQGGAGVAIAIAIVTTLIVSVSGTLSALGDMLYPTHTLAQGLHADFAPGAAALLRLRPFHPVVATANSILLVWLAGMLRRTRRSASTSRYALLVTVTVYVQISVGVINLWLMAPVWMQLLHLFVADILWMFVVLLCAAALADPVGRAASVTRDEVYA